MRHTESMGRGAGGLFQELFFLLCKRNPGGNGSYIVRGNAKNNVMVTVIVTILVTVEVGMWLKFGLRNEFAITSPFKKLGSTILQR